MYDLHDDSGNIPFIYASFLYFTVLCLMMEVPWCEASISGPTPNPHPPSLWPSPSPSPAPASSSPPSLCTILIIALTFTLTLAFALIPRVWDSNGYLPIVLAQAVLTFYNYGILEVLVHVPSIARVLVLLVLVHHLSERPPTRT